MVRRTPWKIEHWSSGNDVQVMRLRKIGKWEMGIVGYRVGTDRLYFYVRDDYGGENPSIYDDYRVAYDNPYRYPASVKDWFSNNAYDLVVLKTRLEMEARR